MSVIEFEEKRAELAAADKELIDKLIGIHADVCTGIDLTKALYPEITEKHDQALVDYEQVLSKTIARLKQLSPHID